MKKIKIAYLGGGSKVWARVFMTDLALAEGICGEIALYDIDVPAAELNKRIGERINEDANTVTKWDYKVYTDIGAALDGADFVAASILPERSTRWKATFICPKSTGYISRSATR